MPVASHSEAGRGDSKAQNTPAPKRCIKKNAPIISNVLAHTDGG